RSNDNLVVIVQELAGFQPTGPTQPWSFIAGAAEHCIRNFLRIEDQLHVKFVFESRKQTHKLGSRLISRTHWHKSLKLLETHRPQPNSKLRLITPNSGSGYSALAKQTVTRAQTGYVVFKFQPFTGKLHYFCGHSEIVRYDIRHSRGRMWMLGYQSAVCQQPLVLKWKLPQQIAG